MRKFSGRARRFIVDRPRKPRAWVAPTFIFGPLALLFLDPRWSLYCESWPSLPVDGLLLNYYTNPVGIFGIGLSTGTAMLWGLPRIFELRPVLTIASWGFLLVLVNLVVEMTSPSRLIPTANTRDWIDVATGTAAALIVALIMYAIRPFVKALD